RKHMLMLLERFTERSAAAHSATDIGEHITEFRLLGLPFNDRKRARKRKTGGEHRREILCEENLLLLLHGGDTCVPIREAPRIIGALFFHFNNTAAFAANHPIQLKPIRHISRTVIHLASCFLCCIPKLHHSYSEITRRTSSIVLMPCADLKMPSSPIVSI